MGMQEAMRAATPQEIANLDQTPLQLLHQQAHLQQIQTQALTQTLKVAARAITELLKIQIHKIQITQALQIQIRAV
jgi:hypothetical protein